MNKQSFESSFSKVYSEPEKLKEQENEILKKKMLILIIFLPMILMIGYQVQHKSAKFYQNPIMEISKIKEEDRYKVIEGKILNKMEEKLTMYDYTNESLFIDHVIRNGPFKMAHPHKHQRFEIYFLKALEGTGTQTIDGKSYPLTENSLVLIDKNLSHHTDFSFSSAHERYLLEISPTFFSKAAVN